MVGAGVALWVSAGAVAGVGPWTIGAGDRSVFLSASYHQWSALSGSTPEFRSFDLGTSITRTQLDAIVSYGLWSSAEIELAAGLAYGAVTRRDAPLCSDLPLAPCEEVFGLVPTSGRLKVRLLDELAGAPFTLTTGPVARLGSYTRPTRVHLTQIGEGQTDLGGFVSLGRSGSIGGGWSFAGFVEGGAVARLPAAKLGAGQKGKGPGPEVSSAAQLLVIPRHEVAVGADVRWVERPVGHDFETTDVADPDRFSSLAVRRVEVGGSLLLRSIDRVSVVLSGQRVVHAKNNPADRWTVSIGVGWYASARSGDDQGG